MSKTALLIGLLVALLSASARADSWVRPEPTSFHSRGFGYVAEIFPPHSRQNSGDKPLCYFYELGYPGSDWRIDARLKWKAPLVNERMPYQALISQAGDLITLNEHGSVGYRNAIVIYDQLGRATKAYELDDLLPADEISMNENTNKIPISTSSRWWNRDARYYFYQEPSRFYVVLPWGTALELLVKDGTFRYGAVGNFPELAGARSNPHASEEVEVWQTSLRFSRSPTFKSRPSAPGDPEAASVAPICGPPRSTCGVVAAKPGLRRRLQSVWRLVQNHAQQRAMDFETAVVINEAQVAKLIHKMAHA